MKSTMSIGPSFTAVNLYKTITVPRDPNQSSERVAVVTQGFKAQAECRQIEKELKGTTRNLFVYNHPQMIDGKATGVFDIIVADGKEGKLLKAAKNAYSNLISYNLSHSIDSSIDYQSALKALHKAETHFAEICLKGLKR